MILITIPLLQFHLHQSYIGITECSRQSHIHMCTWITCIYTCI